MTKFMKSISLLLAVLLAMSLSFTVLADESNVESDAVSESVSADASTEESNADTSKEESKADTSKEESKADTSKEESKTENKTEAVEDSTFPWARVITLIVIVVLIVIAWVLTKTNSKLGQRIKKFVKEYASEIKKVSWSSPKDTAKATGVVLVIVIIAALAIGLLDLGFTQLIKGLVYLFS